MDTSNVVHLKYEKSLNFWKMAINYLALVQAALGMTIKNENRSVVVSATSNEGISEADFVEATKWSDFNIIIPLLFDFYHGLELLLKGFVWLEASEIPRGNHNITKLLKEFGEGYSDKPNYDPRLYAVLAKYIASPPTASLLKEFFKDNKISVDNFYNALRYPYDMALTKRFNHHLLKYNDVDAIPLFEGMVRDIGEIMVQTVKLGRLLDPKTHSE